MILKDKMIENQQRKTIPFSSTMFILLCAFMTLCVTAPVEEERKKLIDELYNLPNNTQEVQAAQDQEYIRYLLQISSQLKKDPAFKKAFESATTEDMSSGKLAEQMNNLGHNVRRKLDELKRLEVEYQRDLIRKNKKHMSGVEGNEWNPIHMEDKVEFGVEDYRQLLSKHREVMEREDVRRREDFKELEMRKEHERREKLKKMSDEEREVEEEKHSTHAHKRHEKMHEPGHKAQMEEVWEQEDGLDPESFDMKTFFNLHDKNSDGHLDEFETETLFLRDLDKVYNESDPDTDPAERDEEMHRMREYMMKGTDVNKDGLISLEEFMDVENEDNYFMDEEWTPLTDQDQFTEDELHEYERKYEREMEAVASL